MSRKILSLILALVLVLDCLPLAASAEETSGKCGENATWAYEPQTGVLTISGYGDMYDYDVSNNPPPWIMGIQYEATSIVLEEGVTSVGKGAFSFFEGLAAVTFPDSVTVIREGAFSNCPRLSSVTISNAITQIEEEAFSNCEKLTVITFPDTLTTIGSKAFAGTGLSTVRLPEALANVGDGAFGFCKNLTDISVDENNPTYTSVDGILYNKQKTEILQYPAGKTASSFAPTGITEIAGYAFGGCEHLETISTPENVTTIGRGAFYDCTQLRTIAIPSTLNTLAELAFFNCPSLSSIELPEGITSIGYETFYGCEALQSFTIPSTVTSIGPGAFGNCSALTSITIPGNVKTVENEAFWGSGLTAVTIENGVETIGGDAFPPVDTIAIPDSLTSLLPHSFSARKSYSVSAGNPAYSSEAGIIYNKGKNIIVRAPLETAGTITIPAGVTEIGEWAFYACSNVSAVEMPDGLERVGDSAFSATNIKSVVFPDSVTELGMQIFNNTPLESISLPKGLKTIVTGLLWQNTLDSIVIPDGVTTIEDRAFTMSTVGKVTIPASVTQIGENAFGWGTETVLYVEKGSYAETYAKQHGYTFIATDGTTPNPPVIPNPPIGPTDPEPTVETVTTEDGNTATITTQPDGSREIEVKTASGETVAKVDLPADPGVGKKFEDVKSWYEGAVDKATAYGLFNGTSETQFSPGRPMTRGMLATVLYNLSGKSQYGVGEGAFGDVKKDIWYEDAVDWAAKTGVTSGTSKTEFSPNRSITREQLVTMLYRYAKLIGADTKNTAGLEKFPDAGQVSGYAKESMQWAVAEGFISGRANGGKDYIAPQGTATRAEVAAVLTRFVEFLK